MAYENIKEKFKTMGAQAVIAIRDPLTREQRRNALRRNGPRVNYTVDVKERRNRGETFEMLIAPEAADDVEITVPSIDKAARHLILAVRNGENYAQYLCGHDERHWFIASLPRNVGNIRQAIETLKPAAAALSQKQQGVAPKNRNKRRNAGYIRQGEWFFIPAPKMDGRANLIIHDNEPLQRGQGKPHIAQYLCRSGGEILYVSRAHPNGLTKQRYLMALKNGEKAATFRQRVGASDVFVKGRISHPDHKTVVLEGWHRIVPNTETNAPWRQELRFLD